MQSLIAATGYSCATTWAVSHGGGGGNATRNSNEPHAQRRGWLKNGNPVGDLRTAPCYRAKTRKGTPCNGPAMRNGRCRMHGGASTGPLTPIGRARSAQANWKHGFPSPKAKEEAKLLRGFLHSMPVYPGALCVHRRLTFFRKLLRRHRAERIPNPATGSPQRARQQVLGKSNWRSKLNLRWCSRALSEPFQT